MIPTNYNQIMFTNPSGQIIGITNRPVYGYVQPQPVFVQRQVVVHQPIARPVVIQRQAVFQHRVPANSYVTSTHYDELANGSVMKTTRWSDNTYDQWIGYRDQRGRFIVSSQTHYR
jgi:hypothetical protein